MDFDWLSIFILFSTSWKKKSECDSNNIIPLFFILTAVLLSYDYNLTQL